MYIGVDLGGTNIVTGLVSKEGKIIDSCSIPTESILGPEVIINKISESVKEVMCKKDIDINQISSIGIGIPGIANSDGIVIQCVNLGWENIDVKSELERLTGIK
ncbi:MAG: ROK family protein, partial [Acidaminobacteraceae bacterium]